MTQRAWCFGLAASAAMNNAAILSNRCRPACILRRVCEMTRLGAGSVGGLLILGWPLFPLLKAFGDDLHSRCSRAVEVGITVNFPTDAFTLIAQHVAHLFQVANDPANFRH